MLAQEITSLCGILMNNSCAPSISPHFAYPSIMAFHDTESLSVNLQAFPNSCQTRASLEHESEAKPVRKDPIAQHPAEEEQRVTASDHGIPRDHIPMRHFIKHSVCRVELGAFHIQVNQRVENKDIKAQMLRALHNLSVDLLAFFERQQVSASLEDPGVCELVQLHALVKHFRVQKQGVQRAVAIRVCSYQGVPQVGVVGLLVEQQQETRCIVEPSDRW
ncbi:hypothetical protein AMTR_s00069p00036080 [Amborella trichopoda]|uniref:Uncharacterized protein n=1 Tax=Amborella trichopoda TaxID=13333 RepID=U5DAN9_AMBTC|nr:hypothetical protein AMTR_s00069p00036080 [Amborella trichopoda]